MHAYEAAQEAAAKELAEFDHFDYSDIDAAAAEQEKLFYVGSPERDPEQDAALTTDEKLDELLTILRPLAPLLESLPELAQKIDPLLEGLRTSPVLKMMGVKF